MMFFLCKSSSLYSTPQFSLVSILFIYSPTTLNSYPRLFIFDDNNFLLFLYHRKTEQQQQRNGWEENQPNKRNESNFLHFMLSFPSHKKDKEVEQQKEETEERKKMQIVRQSEVLKKEDQLKCLWHWMKEFEY